MFTRKRVFRLADVNAIDAEPVPDEELVRRLADGRREALDRLHERYGPLVTSLAARHLDRAAADNHLQVVHSEWFGEGDSLPVVGKSPQFMEAAFSAKQGGPPVTVDVTQGKVVLVVSAVQAARYPSFDEWRSHIETDYKQGRAGEMLTQKTHERADRAHALHDLKAAAKEAGATVKTTDWLTRSSNVPELGPMSGPASAAFDMQPGQISDAQERGNNGGVFEVLEKQAPTAADLAARKESIRQQLFERKRQMRWQMFSFDLRARLLQEKKIEINQEEWKRMTGNTNPLEVRMEIPLVSPGALDHPDYFSIA